ncbi:MAG TPA: indolepyruvate oxidoreductase subunit beta [Candidatus Mailhella excrementigallinarum]|nr:MAG: pyruvate ferredoxin oxidoreductase [Desulfovibrionaceae bacterium]HIV65017.1 indolepyruvate oxidoreductase subunit beta [Candidatus Mailhella excrementigallinarum]
MNTLKIYFVGVGGQGNVLASKLVGEAALEAGVPVVLSETHGMAQRGGVVESTAVLGGALSPTIADGCADILLAFEPLEAVRALNKIHRDSLVITSTAPLKPFSPAGDDKAYPPVPELLAYLNAKCGRVLAFDGREIALAQGNALGLNMVMLGALYASGVMPIQPETQKKVIAAGTKEAFVPRNLACFEAGLHAGTEAMKALACK